MSLRHLTIEELMRYSHRLKLLEKDAGKVIEFLDKLFSIWEANNSDPSGVLHDALMTAAVIVYARSFTRSESPDCVENKIAFNILDVSKDNFYKELHNRIIETRHKAIAHSDWSRRATAVEFVNDIPVRATNMTAGWENIQPRHFHNLAYKVFVDARYLVAQIDRGLHPF